MNKTGRMAAAIAVALVAIYLGATWYTGRLAQQRVNQFVAKIDEQFAGQVRIVKRDSAPGMFSSVEDITLAIENPMLALAMNQASGPLEFTFHNVIAHGPLPGLRSIGVARIETSLVLTDEVRTKLKDVLGTDKPLAVAVTLGWTGSTRIDLTSPKMTVQLPDGAGTLQWQGLDARIKYSRDFKDFDMDAALPGMKVASTSGVAMELVDFKLTGDLQSKFETLYVGDEAITVKSIKIVTPANHQTGAPASTLSMNDLAYVIKLTASDDYLNMDAKMGAAAYEAQAMQLKDLHFDFAMNHLHGPSAGKLVKAFQDYSTELQARQTQLAAQLADREANTEVDDEADGVDTELAALAADADNAPDFPVAGSAPNFDSLKPHMIAMLQQKPELIIEHIGFAGKEGALKISGRVSLDEITDQDFEPRPDPARLIGKVIAIGDVQLSKGIIATLSAAGAGNVEQTIAQYEQQGLLVRKGDQWEAHLEFKRGALTVNGKKLGGR